MTRLLHYLGLHPHSFRDVGDDPTPDDVDPRLTVGRQAAEFGAALALAAVLIVAAMVVMA